jgi:outer membrane protein OmpA-like peptidoglycan-associated protein
MRNSLQGRCSMTVTLFGLLLAALSLCISCQAHHPVQSGVKAGDPTEAKKLAELERMIQLQQDQIGKIYSGSHDDREWSNVLPGGDTGGYGDNCDTLMKMEIYYDYAEFDADAVGRGMLDEVAKRMAEHPSSWIEIYGYADPTSGTPYKNMAMSFFRAGSAMNYLVQKFAIPMRRVWGWEPGLD